MEKTQSIIKNTVSIFFGLAILSLFAASECKADGKNMYPATPEDVVRKFCQLDAEGMWLQGDTMLEVEKLVTWYDAGAEVMYIIDSFKVGKATIYGDKASVPVDYKTIGSTDSFEFSEPSPKWKNPYTYELIKKGGIWKIDSPISAPHVHWKTAIVYLKPHPKDEPARITQLESIINKIFRASKEVNKTKK